MNKRIKRLVIFSTIIFVFALGITQYEIFPQDNIRTELDRFVEAFIFIKKYYVEPVESDKLISGAIEGLLGKLDPHSVYIPKKDIKQVNERFFESSFEGIGIEFIVLNKVLTVVSPTPGGPSEAVGILPGDQIIRIDGKSAYAITEDEVFQKLRGPKGSKVEITIARLNQPEPFDVVITRDKIPINSIYISMILDDGITGYIFLARFAKTTSDSLEAALIDLESRGMKQLILDLRGNSGGLLDQAVGIADKFIPGGHKLVYTRGRTRNSDEDYYSTNRSTHPMYPLIVMIDHGSASASEIVAGAIQDLDRGLVVGQTSFGKGLVQHQLPLKDGSAIRLTVARYYTPSGRMIQRPYENGLVDYYTEAYDDERDTQQPDSGAKVFTTRSGRKVYGGGGIRPDSLLKAQKITRFTNQLIRLRTFFELGSQYASTHRKLSSDFQKFIKEFSVDDPVLEELKAITKKNDLQFSQEAFDKDIVFIREMIKQEIARNLWDSRHFYITRALADSEVQQAASLMSEAKKVLSYNQW